MLPLPAFELVDVLDDGRPFLRCVGGAHHGSEFVVNRPHLLRLGADSRTRDSILTGAVAFARRRTAARTDGIARDRSGAALGWRFWDVAWTSHGGVVLTSPVRFDPWHPGAHAARCPACRRSPQMGCRCGLYAYGSLGAALPEWGLDSSRVLGLVRGWGRVVLHELGWRSEFAQPLLLMLSDPFRVAVGSLGARYECEVLPFGTVIDQQHKETP
ncbi:MAG: hypothetical protein QOG87_261 [Actinomycetota bacterium]